MEFCLQLFWFSLHTAISENTNEMSKFWDVGGPPDRRKQRLSRFANAIANEVEVPNLQDEFISHTLLGNIVVSKFSYAHARSW